MYKAGRVWTRLENYRRGRKSIDEARKLCTKPENYEQGRKTTLAEAGKSQKLLGFPD
jgi:hypothetical protein